LALLNKAIYSSQFKDVWFQETSKAYAPKGQTIGWQTYTNLSFIGCTEQYQVCDKRSCSPLTGLYAMHSSRPSFTVSAAQAAVFDLAWKALWVSNMLFQSVFLGEDVLLAKEKLYSQKSMSAALDDRQWELEAQNMHNTSLAIFQSRIIEYASPPDLHIRSNFTANDQLIPPSDPELKWLCNNIKIRSSEHTNFSMLGLIFLLCFGLIITILSIACPANATRRATKGKPGYTHLEWIQGNVLYMQHRLFEYNGIRSWRNASGSVPVLNGFSRSFSGQLDTESLEMVARQEVVMKQDGPAQHPAEEESGSTGYEPASAIPRCVS
jgi:hypothetical protein